MELMIDCRPQIHLLSLRLHPRRLQPDLSLIRGRDRRRDGDTPRLELSCNDEQYRYWLLHLNRNRCIALELGYGYAYKCTSCLGCSWSCCWGRWDGVVEA